VRRRLRTPLTCARRLRRRGMGRSGRGVASRLSRDLGGGGCPSNAFSNAPSGSPLVDRTVAVHFARRGSLSPVDISQSFRCHWGLPRGQRDHAHASSRAHGVDQMGSSAPPTARRPTHRSGRCGRRRPAPHRTAGPAPTDVAQPRPNSESGGGDGPGVSKLLADRFLIPGVNEGVQAVSQSSVLSRCGARVITQYTNHELYVESGRRSRTGGKRLHVRCEVT
jgi:hypothetical protein